MPRRRARDQNGGILTEEYYSATLKYLAPAGLPSAAVEEVGRLLGAYVAEQAAGEDSQSLAMRPDHWIDIGGSRGTVGASDAAYWTDRLLPERDRRYPARPMSAHEAKDFAERFPAANNIKVIWLSEARPAPPQRSPERERLATAIEHHARAVERLARAREAFGRLRLDEAAAAHEKARAEQELAATRERAPRAMVARLLGGHEDTTPSFEDATAA
jgi:hypothetical protein